MLLREFVDAIRTLGLDALLVGSEFDGAHRSSLMKSVIVCAAFDIAWSVAVEEAECKRNTLCLYDCDKSQVFEFDE